MLPGGLKIAVGSDLHFDPDNTDKSKELSAVVYNPELVDALLWDARKEGAEILLLTGDVVNGGKIHRHTALAEKLQQADKKDRKHIQAFSDSYIEMLQSYLTVLNDALWLTDKFGEGVYTDVPGLCKVACTTDDAKDEDNAVSIEEKGWSLTPGAYVGIAPQGDDGVDFATRMREIHAELLSLQAESNVLMDTISKNMEEMGL